METEVIIGHVTNDANTKTTKAFIELVSNGVGVEEASKQVGLTTSELLARKEVRKWLEEVSPWYLWDPEVRRKAVIAQMTKEMATAYESKDRTAAARVLIKDPDLGFMNDEPTVVVQLSEEIKKLNPGPLWPEEKSSNLLDDNARQKIEEEK